ncbi:uncharacterized protein Z520_04518 [Fonsecaea multimorphosa CBS 102226]|uniref:Class II aldolase/adducin N-terminal domain-containing protein n=1 Tax=Fonsecaea multimorphosa CBS 102226 TaxID=1442371 RepID=A0A0D2K211_9EURO|nr:uncharacterized protein Z520_04518 [Fonsecaea multimorphosa CBS 102226]KIX99882.1 hypothetical protein Z520_04518 [Fonsecaea multimorphosa CBS 102226]OAL26360.1 hypothetical protein AYO22_04278 [Fonsecaea multimorphosa]
MASGPSSIALRVVGNHAKPRHVSRILLGNPTAFPLGHANASQSTRTISASRTTPAAVATAQQHISTPKDPPNFSPEFTYGAYQSTGTRPVKRIRYPKFQSLESERAFRKLHHAAALRWLGYQGYNNEGAGGHVTVRDPVLPDHFWINPHGKSFSWMTPDDLVLMNPKGEVVEGGNMHSVNPAGWVIHSAVHEARPDVVAAVHCHSVPSKAFSALGCYLEPINQDACRFYRDHGIYSGFGGIALKADEGHHIAAALGNTKGVILQNHGHLTVGKTVDGAAFLFGAMDRCIQAQLLADAACAGRGTTTIKVAHEEAEYSRNVYNDEMVYIMFQSA